jgi:alcohol dehydrogenase class IV
MDCAKGIGIVSTNDKNILNFKGVDKIIIPPPPLILIPTTAGTSADVSQFCIVYNRDELNKIAIISKAIVPDVALIDSETTTTMDNYLTACTGMDALSHAIEAFVSIGSGHLTDSHAIEAVDILFNNLPKLLQNPSNLELREKVMHGSLKAGLAFSNASLGAVHAMAHSLGGFLDLPHGECNSMLLDHVIRFNFKNSVEKFKVIASKFDIDTRGLSTSEIKNKLLSSVISFKKEIGIIDQLSDKGVKSSDIPILAEKAVMDACILTNPRKATKKDISVIFEESM